MSVNKAKILRLFEYIRELYALRYQIVTHIDKQVWHYFISDIPQDNTNITLNYLDRTESDSNEISLDSYILKVHKPEFERVPTPPLNIQEWLEHGWDRYNQQPLYKEYIDKSQGEIHKRVYFKDDVARVNSYENWNDTRGLWVNRQKSIAKTREFFQDLYNKYLDLKRESETYELMVGQGIIECFDNNNNKVYHPILLKRLDVEFDAKKNIISLVDTNVESELYSQILQSIDSINHSEIKGIKQNLSQNYYHPLDRNDTIDFLEQTTHQLNADSRFVKEDKPVTIYEKIVVYNKPVFFIRKRIGGVFEAIDSIIEQISNEEEVYGPLVDLVGVTSSILPEEPSNIDITDELSAINGEDKDILLSKEANKEQLEIAKKIERYNAVLVQGPPGTGKTHTIANLIGHFLAQGKNILVTSQTKKALTVVKDKVAEQLQTLCVSVLSDNTKDMEKSIDGIIDYMSRHSSEELLVNIENLKKKREAIISDIKKVRNQILIIKHKERETIIIDGKGYTPSEAGKYVYENRETCSWIPGKVVLYAPLPVSMGDFELLYRTNSTISKEEEKELSQNIPNPNNLISPKEFTKILERIEQCNSEVVELTNKIKVIRPSCIIGNGKITIGGYLFNNNVNQEGVATLSKKIEETNDLIRQFDKWNINAILAGKMGGSYKNAWLQLINSIEDTCIFAEQNYFQLIGKEISIGIDINDKYILALEQMKEHLSSGKKLSPLVLTIHRPWSELYKALFINGRSISSKDDFEMVLAYINLGLKRKQIGSLWNELITKNGGQDINSFGDQPELICKQRVSKIKECLDWYESIYTKIRETAYNAGLNLDLLLKNDDITNPIEEVSLLFNMIYSELPLYIRLIMLVNKELYQLHQRFNKCYSDYTNDSIKESLICEHLASAIKENDSEKYNKYFCMLENLYEKNYSLNERKRILDKIYAVAPDWYNHIINRVGIHGKDIVPNNIYEVWLWKQFDGILDEIALTSYDELNKNLRNLSFSLKQSTIQLTEAMAWYHLLKRVENDIEKKRALQGWKLTERKIGKGTGRNAPMFKREAQKLMVKCQTSVPAWIMPINKALESLNPKENKFDIIIVDEASQSDISALAIMYLGKKIVIVGDNEQVSPLSVGLNIDRMNALLTMYIKDVIPNSHLYDLKTSLYDIALTTFNPIMLKEHFRCVPQIINYSNRLSYNFKIKPLRDESTVVQKPATVVYRVEGERKPNKTNPKEAIAITALILSCINQPEYNCASFGVISLLGDEQAVLIDKFLREKISPIEYENRSILCGNASHFQGDERDVIFLSLVDSNSGDSILRRTTEGTEGALKKRYNVAVSRARNQIWVVHSLDVGNDLQPEDMRRDLIEYMQNPEAVNQQMKLIEAKSESPFEQSVGQRLVSLGYNIIPQWPVGAFRIDMVASYNGDKVAIECDGELYHSGDDKVREDMERETILRRLGWRFIRIRGSEYYRNPESTINRVVNELEEYGIYPEGKKEHCDRDEKEMLNRIKNTASIIMKKWEDEKEDEGIERTQKITQLSL